MPEPPEATRVPKDADGESPSAPPPRLPADEEARLLAASNSHKAAANALFAAQNYDAALNKYDEAVAVCPGYLDFDMAVLRSNKAACHLKLDEWKEAANAATSALDGLDKLERESGQTSDTAGGEQGHGHHRPLSLGKGGTTATAALAEASSRDDNDDVEEEIVSSGATRAGLLPSESPSTSIPSPSSGEAQPASSPANSEGPPSHLPQPQDITRIRAKALLRRGRARCELGGWTNLEGALDDYQRLAASPNLLGALGGADRAAVRNQLRPGLLEARVHEAREKETAEMWGKLKELGNGILKPFGLSTDNFKMVKDEKTGGYSMNFQGGGSSKEPAGG